MPNKVVEKVVEAPVVSAEEAERDALLAVLDAIKRSGYTNLKQIENRISQLNAIV